MRPSLSSLASTTAHVAGEPFSGGSRMSFEGFRYAGPPTRSGGTGAVEVDGIDGINLYA